MRRAGGMLLLLSAAAGCGSQPATVSGAVRFKGEPVSSGTVLFHGTDGRVEHGSITEGGRYTIADPPRGPVRVTVKSHAASPVGMPGAGKMPAGPADPGPPKEKRDGRFVPIPPRYLDPNTSGLAYTVGAGPQSHDIELLP